MQPALTPSAALDLQGCMTRNPWRAVTDGALGEACVGAALEIAGALERRPDPAVDAEWVALFFAYLDRALPGRGFGERASSCLDHATERLGRDTPNPALFGGVVGTAWALRHLDGPEDADDESFVEIDELIDAAMRAPSPVELVRGAAGYAIYALERLPSPRARALLDGVVEVIEASAEPAAEGITWARAPSIARADQAAETSYDLGLAHGVAGVIAALGAMARAGVHVARCRAVLDDAVPWLLARKLGPRAATAFGYTLADTRPARTAWCYGDLGIASALLVAAEGVGRGDWKEEAARIAARAAARAHADTGIDDASVCHGAAGLVLVFLRFYEATSDERFARAAAAWCARALAYRAPERGPAGFGSWEPDAHAHGWVARYGLLDGAAGVGLALLAAATNIAPSWDRALALSARGPQ